MYGIQVLKKSNFSMSRYVILKAKEINLSVINVSIELLRFSSNCPLISIYASFRLRGIYCTYQILYSPILK